MLKRRAGGFYCDLRQLLAALAFLTLVELDYLKLSALHRGGDFLEF